MSSNDNFGSSNGESSFDQTPSTNPPWPDINPVQQAQFERKYFEEGATIHFDRLPLYYDGLIRGLSSAPYIVSKVVRFAVAAQRPLTASEVDGTSEAAAHSFRNILWINPLTITTAAFFTWYSRRTFSFTFYRPKLSRFDPFVFPTKRAPLFKGARAVYAWHATRFFTYLPPFWILNIVFFGSMTESTFEARVARDPRLSNMMQEIKTRRMQNMRSQVQPGSPSAQRGMGIPQGPPPSDSGSQSYQYDTFSGSGSAPSTSATPSTPQPTWTRNTQSQAPPSQPRDDVSDLFDDDDGSPVPASVRRAEAQQARSSGGGSTWDRLRQQAQSGSTQWTQGDSSGQEQGWGQLRQDKTQNTKEVQRNTEGFAYTKDEEDKEQNKYEKEKAQKEFDALLEAERRGGSGRR